jgi:tripartite-type tricarboxylate transporter receptor subunit TctC
VSEAGAPGYEVTVWFGVVGPAGMPPAIVRKLNSEMNAILKMEDVKRRFEDQGVEPVGGPPSQFADHISAEIQKWGKVVKDANIQPE